MTDMPPLLEARALVKRLGGRLVVDGVDLDCHAGQVLGLLGPNGAGKTTTLRMLYGFLSADGGAIRFEGADVSKDLERFKRQLGVCTQDDTFDGDFTVRQNLEMAARYFRPRPPEVRRRVDELLERFALVPYAGDKPEALSGGFRWSPWTCACCGSGSSAIEAAPKLVPVPNSCRRPQRLRCGIFTAS